MNIIHERKPKMGNKKNGLHFLGALYHLYPQVLGDMSGLVYEYLTQLPLGLFKADLIPK